MANSDPPPYTVEYIGTARDSQPILRRRAIERGLETEFDAQMKYIEQRLRNDPTVWGDPIRNYRLKGMVDYHAMHKDLNVHFAVNESSRLVWLYKLEATHRRALE